MDRAAEDRGPDPGPDSGPDPRPGPSPAPIARRRDGTRLPSPASRQPLRVLVAPDSFKGSLTAEEAAAAMARGVEQGWPGTAVTLLPLADGGEGTAAALVRATGGRWFGCRVTGPLGEPVDARWGLLGDGRTAVIEMAAASGLLLVPPGRQRPLEATSFGTGELIRDALDRGCRRLLVAIGGSATTDGGTGMLAALGARFLDAAGQPLPPGGGALTRLARIDLGGLDPRLREAEIEVACDVDNPLTGPRGAARVYAPQKGATPEQVEVLEAGLVRLAEVTARTLGHDRRDEPGAGAAGGLGFGLIAFLGARLRPGAELVMDAAGFDRHLERTDLVLTGEGRTDVQTLAGKLVARVADRCRRLGRPVVVISGAVDPAVEPALKERGVAALLAATPGPMPPRQALARAAGHLEAATAAAMGLLRLGWQLRSDRAS
ncbi:glycerate kinase [Thermaerobacter marianensis DSM 12885]|uniref:Glycerate kinase n=1 Tax=Thermaerobacter marianensis (strain ATCC 700841 / DSM 12885 / JCM 10246 / 7p75a) TaxID=644966 RepID=E6SJ81_THEM7|nr:glycerate kinase [Thermaerobacter marianensis]ADU51009.1 glycerate kinase [Thermaerobacter marianensis DSM 12885]